MDRCGPKHVELKPKYYLKLNQCNYIVYLVGLYIYYKNDTGTLQCQVGPSFEHGNELSCRIKIRKFFE